MRIAILDDYQGVALDMADWSAVAARAEITVFRDTIRDPDALVARLEPFDVLCVMRERTPLPRSIIERLPRLRLIVSTGARNASIDLEAAAERGIAFANTGYNATPTIELTWALILGRARSIVDEATSLRTGGWQRSVGTGVNGKTLAVLGLGRIGSEVARIGKAFGMEIIAWSENLTAERAEAAGAALVSKDELFAKADFLTIHLVLSDRTRGLVDARALGLMRPTAFLINTSRGPIVSEPALLEALREGRIAGAALDVYDVEPLPADHPYRSAANLLATPHIGYVSEEVYRVFYGDTAAQVLKWIEENPAK
ncbi:MULTISPECIES: D-2-hydroxyacid dehydrogenase family protein [Rhodomicrobium]|uniref:D-2-hydroxyacid dehydrogenase family protein n=1 Tax=Rhodomicrobium TaxID=1068 RepID=UPI000B4B4FB3|nr:MULTISPECIES: D-2-hydroxyacid dehydrogenase family protein [Rhodomicrobium]